MARVIIGEPPYRDTEYGSYAAAIRQALADGHRWVVFKFDAYGISSPINLDDFSGAQNSLRLEGGGPHITGLQKFFPADTSPMLYAYTSGWDLHFTGLTFFGNKAQMSAGYPICEFRSVGFSFFKDCLWEEGSGIGLKLGPNLAQGVTFVNCQFLYNNGDGLFVDGGENLTFVGPGSERNGGYNIWWRGKDVVYRGSGIFMGIHLEENVQSPKLFLDRVRGVRVQNGDFLFSNIVIAANAQNNIVEANGLRASAINNQGGTSNILRWNISGNAQGG